MRRVHSTIIGLSLLLGLALLLGPALPAVAQDDGTLDDEAIARLLQVHRDTGALLIDVQRDLDEIPVRIESDDWLVFPEPDGGVVEVDLNDVRKHLPALQVALSLAPDDTARLLEGLKRTGPHLWSAAVVADALPGGISGQSPDAIISRLRDYFAQTPGSKRAAYADRVADLQEQRDRLDQLFVETFEWLDEQGVEITTLSDPVADASPGPTPGTESEGVEYDALEGLLDCESDMPCDEATDSAAAQATPAGTDETAGSEWCWEDYGQWKLWGEGQGQPLCEGVESE